MLYGAYKYSTPVGENSISKQFTYAQNVIQWSFDALKGTTECKDERYKIRLRDDRTEGYNVLPNFFISATVDFQRLDYNADNLRLHEGKNQHESSQFSDRLFDRDTLLLSHYDVNFLFVLAMYGRNNAASKLAWKTAVRKRFRERVQEIIRLFGRGVRLKGFKYSLKRSSALDSSYNPGPIPKRLREIETLHYVRNLIV